MTSKIAKGKRAHQAAAAEGFVGRSVDVHRGVIEGDVVWPSGGERMRCSMGCKISVACISTTCSLALPKGSNPGPPYPDARQALQYLVDSPVRRRTPRHEEKVDIEAVVKEVLDVRDRSRALAEEREQLRKWIADLGPWGNFELPREWANKGELRFWFYMVPHHQMRRLDAIDLPWSVVRRDHRFAYVVVVSAEQPTGMPVPVVPLEPRSVLQMRGRLDEVERALEELDYRRIGLTQQREMLRENLDEADDRAARQRASLRALERDQVFAVQGWVPTARIPALRHFAAERRLALTIAGPGPQDTPPTLLDNPPALRGGEGLVEFYMTPAYRLWDPSKAVFFAFATFFAMIFSDAGYALLLGLLLLAMWKRMGRTANGRGLRDVMLALVIFSIVYGVLVGIILWCRAARGLVACVATRPGCQQSTLDDVDFDRRWSGAPRLCQFGHCLVAPAFADSAERTGVGRDHSWRLLRRAGKRLSGASRTEFAAKGRILGPCARWSAGTALQQ